MNVVKIDFYPEDNKFLIKQEPGKALFLGMDEIRMLIAQLEQIADNRPSATMD